MRVAPDQFLIRVVTEAENGQPPAGAEPAIVSLAMVVSDYYQSFGEVPRCIKGALQILLTRGKVKIQFGNGMAERFELNDYENLLTVGEAIEILNACEARLRTPPRSPAPE